jgi:hypothetical protein
VVDLKYVLIKNKNQIAPIVVVNVYVLTEDVGDYVKIATAPEFAFIKSVDHYVKNVVVLNVARHLVAKRLEIENLRCIVCYAQCISDQI